MAAYTSREGSAQNPFVKLYRDKVQPLVGDVGMLKGTVMYEGGAKDSHVFPTVNQVVLRELTGLPGSRGEVTPAVYGNPEAKLKEWGVAIATRISWDAKLSFSTHSPLVQMLAQAIGRRSDQVIIDQVISTYGGTNRGGISRVANTALDSGDEKFYSAATHARQALMNKGVPLDECCLVIRSDTHTEFMKSDHVTSDDFTSAQPSEDARYGRIQGFRVYPIAKDRSEGSLPDNRIIAYHRDAIGLAESLGDIDVMRDPGAFGFIIEAMLNSGAAVVDPSRIVVVETA